MEAPNTDAAVAESSPAPDFQTYRQEADAAELAGRSPSLGEQSAGAPTAQPAEQAVSTETQRDAASETADPPKKGAHLKARLSDLEAEKARLQEELRTVKLLRQELAAMRQPAADTTKPGSDPAPQQPTKAEWKRYTLHPDAPKVEDFDAYEDFTAAQSAFVIGRVLEERQEQARLDAESSRRVQEDVGKIEALKGRLAKAREADPEFDQKVDPGLMQLTPRFALAPGEAPRPANVLIEEIVTSDAAAELLVYFSTPDGQREWGNLIASKTPAALMRAFGRVEARFLGGSRAEPAKPAAAHVTGAPEPPTILGRQPAAADRVKSAAEKGDFASYKAAADAAELAKLRR